MTDEIAAVLPPLYAGWIGTLLEGTIPPETRATCEDCAMCAPAGAPADLRAIYFSPRVKCCTYQPRLPNYLVGRALDDGDFAFAAGRATLESRIDRGVGVTPLGIDLSPPFQILYEHAHEAFGHAEALRCPHYLEEGGGRCGIWRHRNSVCATWFCKYERGAVGQIFWHRLLDLLLAVETSLALWGVLESDLDPGTLDSLFPEKRNPGTRESATADDLDGRTEPALARRRWGRWFGREREFYRDCGTRVNPLGWKDVEQIGGAEVSIRARLVRKAFESLLSENVPERLETGTFQIVSVGREAVRVVAYTGSDPLDLDPAILDVLPFFDGRPAAQALRSIKKELGIRVEADLVRRLADFEILVPPGFRVA